VLITSTKHLKVFSYSLILFSWIFIGCNLEEEHDQFSTSIDNYFQGIDNFSGNVLIAKNNKIIFEKSYGYADRELNTKNDPSTKFNIGSITKPFTAMAILRLVEEKRLALTDTVGQYLINVPESWKPITIHQLLSHTSGIIHSWDILEDSSLKNKRLTLTNSLSLYYDRPLRFEPGSSFSYSGVGYFILAAIIEAITGSTYDQYLNDIFLKPLGMASTGASNPDLAIPELAKGYLLDSTGIHGAAKFYIPLLTGGGHLYSTTKDLLLWDQAITNHTIISKKMTEKMFTPVMENYGYGWDIVTNDTLSVFFHTGFIPGYLSRFDRYPELGLTLIILTNYQADWSPVDSWDITNIILKEAGLTEHK